MLPEPQELIIHYQCRKTRLMSGSTKNKAIMDCDRNRWRRPRHLKQLKATEKELNQKLGTIIGDTEYCVSVLTNASLISAPVSCDQQIILANYYPLTHRNNWAVNTHILTSTRVLIMGLQGWCSSSNCEDQFASDFSQCCHKLQKVMPWVIIRWKAPVVVTEYHAFVTSRLDYCEQLYMGLLLKTVWKLPLVQNAAM